MPRFTRVDESRYVIPQRFADENFPACPLCGSREPLWNTASKYKKVMKYYLIKCSQCNSILSVSEADMTGLSYTTASVQGQLKKSSGKESRVNYVKIEEVGLELTDPAIVRLEKREMPIDELKNYSQKLLKETEQ